MDGKTPPQPAPELAAAMAETRAYREQLAAIRRRLENLAASLEMSAAASVPSRKSDVERQAARRIRDIAAQAAPAVATAGTEHLAAQLAENAGLEG